MSDRITVRRIWLLLIWAGLPAASLLSFLFPPLLRYINRRLLRRVEGFEMDVTKLNIRLFPARIEFHNFSFHQLANLQSGSNFIVSIPKVQLNLQWRQLLKGKIIGSVVIDQPEVLFASIAPDSYDKLMWPFDLPVLLQSLKINGGKIVYRDKSTTPEISIQAVDVWAEALNLTNLSTPYAQLPAKIDLTAMLEGGRITIACAMDPKTPSPTFDLNLEALNIQLPQLNSIFRSYGKFDVSKGEISLFAEIAARDGYFKGYIKPVITNLDILGPEDKFKGFLNRVWEGVVGTAADIFVNHRRDQLATKIPIDGHFKNPKIHITFAILEVFNNAFIRALTASLDFDININSVSDSKTIDKA